MTLGCQIGTDAHAYSHCRMLYQADIGNHNASVNQSQIVTGILLPSLLPLFKDITLFPFFNVTICDLKDSSHSPSLYSGLRFTGMTPL
jgi:hypothetical protein